MVVHVHSDFRSVLYRFIDDAAIQQGVHDCPASARTINTPVGCTIPLLIKLLNVDDASMFGYIELQNVL